jgi:hypothetical protein
MKALLTIRRRPRSATGWRDFLPAAVLLIVGLLGLAAATLTPSGKGNQYAVVAPPWYSPGQTMTLIQDADGRIAGIDGSTRLMVAHSTKPDFVWDLYRAGAWLVIDPGQLQGCVDIQPEVQPGVRSNKA